MIEAMGGEFNANPFAMTAFGGNRIIAHPLGGCGMGETAETGVVAPDGRVFDPSRGPHCVHEGLYVCDGAAVPSADRRQPAVDDHSAGGTRDDAGGAKAATPARCRYEPAAPGARRRDVAFTGTRR